MAGEKEKEPARLKIGAVARLTGLSAHNLRKWEERYGAVSPHRTGSGERLYTRDDVRRLVLIKRLSNAGVPIGEVAKSSLDELDQICESTLGALAETSASARAPSTIRVAVVGNAVVSLDDRGAHADPEIDILLRSDDLKSAKQKLAGRKVDVVVMDCPTVHDGTEQIVSDAIDTLNARAAAVVYGFGARAALNSLRSAGVVTVRAPMDASELRRAVSALMTELSGGERTGDAQLPPAEIPPPRFSQDTVGRIVAMSPSIKCECPHHLAQIVLNLRAFEQYSAECENSSPEDSELHQYLKGVAGRSRAAFEEALARVAESEGIYLRD